MRYISPQSIQLVIRSAKLKPIIYSTLARSSHTVATRGLSNNHSIQASSSKPKYNYHSSNSRRICLQKQAVRHCSYQRKMCYKDAPSGSMDMSKGREVLPTNVKPMHYDLTLEPDLEKFTFEGTVKIEYVKSCGVLQVRRDMLVSLTYRLFWFLRLTLMVSAASMSRKIRLRSP